ncbi:Os02g0621400 [Oryza sativa Japonica Group]|uniref:Os02g0621400 protein n=2 Tax=Oryza sativa subsp. japonica TaxID=39947 RepID=Q6K9F5_ORYSJ|nr:hypothetical protein DAI22_02g251500 [Oryza sativa Japonica Group]BAD21540.1 unknown protein [Oryza sativa Japonica Group]BAD21580.1 unknown protein [Oryza sativa Japonica Group]BAF09374.1 Os02g0621400 [Oryza sativa Japonica Group]BAG98332.1 unnamed protein product [Oryza sativa Japonica Group]|eukprot:NP_001047460.1 Os02g0621400 [Oryza sativa Japonica Group]
MESPPRPHFSPPSSYLDRERSQRRWFGDELDGENDDELFNPWPPSSIVAVPHLLPPPATRSGRVAGSEQWGKRGGCSGDQRSEWRTVAASRAGGGQRRPVTGAAGGGRRRPVRRRRVAAMTSAASGGRWQPA